MYFLCIHDFLSYWLPTRTSDQESKKERFLNENKHAGMSLT